MSSTVLAYGNMLDLPVEEEHFLNLRGDLKTVVDYKGKKEFTMNKEKNNVEKEIKSYMTRRNFLIGTGALATGLIATCL